MWDSNKYSLDIISHHAQFKNRSLKKYNVNGVETVGAWGDEPFEVRFRNNTGQKLQVKVSIYGLESLVHSDKITPQQALRVLGTKADVRETVPSALYCFIKSTSYHQSILHAIKAGGDTDTTAAIVGALAGIKFGMGGINKEFYVVEDFDKLIQLDSQLYNKSSCKYF